jgi:hypothetical protein
VVVVNIQKPRYEERDGDIVLANPLGESEMAEVAEALADMGVSVLDRWNGTHETGSLSLAETAHPSLLAAVRRYHDTCPEHRTVFCGHGSGQGGHDCSWYRRGAALLVQPARRFADEPATPASGHDPAAWGMDRIPCSSTGGALAEPARSGLPQWTAHELAAVYAPYAATDLRVGDGDGDATRHSTGGGKSRVLESYLVGLVRQGHGEDVVTIDAPKDPQVPVQRATVAQLLAAVQAPPSQELALCYWVFPHGAVELIDGAGQTRQTWTAPGLYGALLAAGYPWHNDTTTRIGHCFSLEIKDGQVIADTEKWPHDHPMGNRSEVFLMWAREIGEC